jgi:hypothetical protein
VLGDDRVGHRELVAEAGVEADRQVAGEFEMLLLIVAHRDGVRPIQQDVGRHQHRVGKEAEVAGTLRLVLAGSSTQLPHRSSCRGSGEFDVLGHLLW